MAKPPENSPSNLSALRSMIEGDGYTAYDSLEAAREQESAVVVFEGDYGGTIYLTAPVTAVECDAAALTQVLLDIDEMCWQETGGTSLCFENRPIDSGVAGGMGGGTITAGVWLHPDVEALGIRGEVEEVFAGKRQRIEKAGRSWNEGRPKPKLP